MIDVHSMVLLPATHDFIDEGLECNLFRRHVVGFKGCEHEL